MDIEKETKKYWDSIRKRGFTFTSSKRDICTLVYQGEEQECECEDLGNDSSIIYFDINGDGKEEKILWKRVLPFQRGDIKGNKKLYDVFFYDKKRIPNMEIKDFKKEYKSKSKGKDKNISEIEGEEYPVSKEMREELDQTEENFHNLDLWGLKPY